ncbi:glycosyl hydrolase [Nocardioides bruguierae]|uniref:glycosyl hydrolase n=1 Tax=Nocardioides bruguierae TaxID=2945102 RepID=UPI00202289CE|nr:glycosyl hydrolase [Nocardioides bruguierae]MCL8025478.1 hypothetical protein [Nocardioides bruguierae]
MSTPSHPTPAQPSDRPAAGRPGLTRRSLLGAAAVTAGAVGAVGAVSGPAAATDASAGAAPAGASLGLPGSLARQFRAPGLATAAGFRWWWPHGLVDADEISREVSRVAAAGFGVLEIADVTHSLNARDVDVDLDQHGWGGPTWKAGLVAALTAGARHGVRIDVTVGPSWPASAPITPDDEAACTELAHGQVLLAPGETFTGTAPDPEVEPASGAQARELVAVQAFTIAGYGRRDTILLDGSLVDLTPSEENDEITFTAPADAEAVVLSYWRRGSGQEPEAGPHGSPVFHVVDHFSTAGSDAVKALWRDRVLDAETTRLLRKAGGYLFEDSLEIETDATVWTPRMLTEFADRIGYDLLPWLPAVVELDEKYPFSFDTDVTGAVRDDFNSVISDLYRDHHLLPLQAFARTLGMGLRVQPYGLETDALEHSALLDVPETESLGFKNLDDYRMQASGRDLAGGTILSCEAACYNGAAYSTTWDRALTTINSIMVAGVNQSVLHGFAYASAPGATWPGFAAFSPYYNGAIGYGEAWGPRTPQWQHMPDVAGYLSRTQLVLQSGVSRHDVVFFRQKGYASTGIGATWATNDGVPIGWSHSFITDNVLDRPEVRVEDGRLAPDGPAWKAMIMTPDFFRGGGLLVEPDAAERLLALGRAGLRVVMLGDWTQAQPEGVPQAGETARVRTAMTGLAGLATTRVVAAAADIPGALADLGVERDVVHESSTLMHLRRHVDGADLYYLANAKHAENRRLQVVDADVWLTSDDAAAVPVLLDPWSGATSPISLWERDGGRVRVHVTLQPGQSAVVALVPARAQGAHAVSTTGSDVRSRPAGLSAVVEEAGPVTAVLASGRTVRGVVDRVVAPLTPASWRLEVEDWQPGATASETTVTTHEVSLDALAPWTGIAGLEDVSGIGRYTTTVTTPEDWGGTDRARLDLGAVTDTFRVWVNGEQLPACDRLDTVVDLGGRLRAGDNEVVVEVTTTLFNRLRTVTPEVYGVGTRQDYGLLGPVSVVPYAEVALR